MNQKQRILLRGKYGGKCAYCGCELPKRWHADHMVPILRINKYERVVINGVTKLKTISTGKCEKPHLDTMENLVPACPSCNNKKSSMELETFRTFLQESAKRLAERDSRFRMAVKFGLVTVNEPKVRFWFEKFKGE